MNNQAHPNQFDYNYITDGIYLGTNQCCQTHFDERLRREGIEADISLEQERLDQPFGIFAYLWLPVVDHAAPRSDQLELGVNFLGALNQLGKQVYVHCKNGHGRAPTLVAAYLIAAKGLDSKQAVAFIQARRPTIHLQEVQREALRHFQQKHSYDH